MWQIKKLNSGRFCLENQRTLDTTDDTWATETEAAARALELNERAKKIAADIRARSQRAENKQAEIAAIRPTQILTNGQDY